MSAENEEVDTDLAQEKIQPDAVAKEVETSEGSKDDSIVMATDAERGDDEENVDGSPRGVEERQENTDTIESDIKGDNQHDEEIEETSVERQKGETGDDHQRLDEGDGQKKGMDEEENMVQNSHSAEKGAKEQQIEDTIDIGVKFTPAAGAKVEMKSRGNYHKINVHNPLHDASIISKILYHWLNYAFYRAWKRGLRKEDMFPCPPPEKAQLNYERFAHLWDAELAKRGPKRASISRVVIKFMIVRLFLGAFIMMCGVGFNLFSAAYVIRNLLEYIQQTESDVGYGMIWVAGLCVCQCAAMGFIHFQFYYNTRTGTRIRAAVIATIYRRAINVRTLKGKSAGEIINLCTNDGQRLFEMGLYLPMLISSPPAAITGIVYTYFLIGPSALFGMGVFFMYYPFSMGVAKLVAYFRQRAISLTDKRVRLMNEVISSIKLIKMYAWEVPFSKKVEGIREKEKIALEHGGYVQSINTMSIHILPVIVAMLTLVLHTALGNNLTPAQAFSYIACLTALRITLFSVPMAIKATSESVVAFPRIKELLLMESLRPYEDKPTDLRLALEITNATFAWDRGQAMQPNDKSGAEVDEEVAESIPNGAESEQKGAGQESTETLLKEEDIVKTLFEVDLRVEKGSLLGICGSVGSGKSSLMNAILSHMIKVEGSVGVDGAFAYAPQQACILNATLRENILFGLGYEEKRYEEVIEGCGLAPDLEVLANGDQTEIGERGINLSGGQKQRISLARAVYSQRDIYLFDDPLSAVDAHVGQHIFENVIAGLLKGKTILFVTHQLQFLSQCDAVLFMKSGRIAANGPHNDIMKTNAEYSALIQNYLQRQDVSDESEQTTSERPLSMLSLQSSEGRPVSLHSLHGSSNENESNPASLYEGEGDTDDEMSMKNYSGKLNNLEETDTRSKANQTYIGYLKAAGGFLATSLVILIFFLAQACSTLSSFWLSHWLEQGNGTEIDLNSTLVGEDFDVYSETNISDNPKLLFYQMVYLGLVLGYMLFAIFRIYVYVKTTLRAATNLHNNVFVNIIHSPMSFFDTTPSGQILNRFSKDLDEADIRLPFVMESLLQNAMFVTFNLLTIIYIFPWYLVAAALLFVALALLNRFFRPGLHGIKMLDNTLRSPWFSHVTTTMHGLSTIHAYNKKEEFIAKFEDKLDTHTVPLMLFMMANRWLALRFDILTIILGVVTSASIVLTHGKVEPGLAGLALTFTMQFLGVFQFTMRLMAETEARFTSIQRIIDYTELPREAAPVIKDQEPPLEWPDQGRIAFKDVKMRYRDNLPLVLRGVSFSVRPQEKIGIIGRTGSGKSSLGVALYRLTEVASGSLSIDQRDIGQMGLRDLRSKLSIIPQDPVLFVGTVRYNLDPFDDHTDESIWVALERTHMKDTISGLEQQLMAPVVENGDNFSVGERQLMCMARALLRNSKILFLDEATAAIDSETDTLIQATIREAFQDCTMLTIAHRLNTIVDSSRILVMDNGKIAEFDKPSVLMTKETSIFRSMMEALSAQKDVAEAFGSAE